MKDNTWAEELFRYMYRKLVDSQRTRWLTSKYTAGSVRDMVTNGVKRKVREEEKIYQRAAMGERPTMSNYRKRTGEIRREAFYDNSKGSALLFEARSGGLRKRSYQLSEIQQRRKTMYLIPWEC